MPSLIGVNLPYFSGAYGHDLAPNERLADWPTHFEAGSGYRPLIEAKQLGFEAVRIWLCEGGEGIVTEGGHIVGVSSKLLESVDVLIEAASRIGIKIYFGVLDANGVRRENDQITRSILSSRDRALEFGEFVLAPLLTRFASPAVLGVDLVNEPETASPDCSDDPEATFGDAIPWELMAPSLNHLYQAATTAFDGIVSFGSGHVFLPKLLEAVPTLGAVDIHMYHTEGGLPSRRDLADYTGDQRLLDPNFPLLGGECGTPKGNEAFMVNYIGNATNLGYCAAFLWKLEGELIEVPKSTDQRYPGRKRSLTGDGTLIRDALLLRAQM